MKVLAVDPPRCTGCRLCEVACSLHHDGVVNPAAARLGVVAWDEDGVHVPTVCQQCDVAMCEHVCQPGAISRDPATNALVVNYERCIGCRLCVVACPYGAMSFHPVERRVVKCNLCAGDPRCVQFCETGAVRFAEPEAIAFEKRVATARTLTGGP